MSITRKLKLNKDQSKSPQVWLGSLVRVPLKSKYCYPATSSTKKIGILTKILDDDLLFEVKI